MSRVREWVDQKKNIMNFGEECYKQDENCDGRLTSGKGLRVA